MIVRFPFSNQVLQPIRSFLVQMLLGLFLIYIPVSAQEKDQKSSFWSKWSPGGNISGQFGNPTRVQLAPMLIYGASPTFSLGFGPQYQYYQEKFNAPNRQGNTEFQSHYIGGNAFMQYHLGKYFRLRSEVEALQGTYYNFDTDQESKAWVWSPFLGATLNIPIAPKLGLQFTLLYNVNHNPNQSIYRSPWVFRMGMGR